MTHDAEPAMTHDAEPAMTTTRSLRAGASAGGASRARGEPRRRAPAW